MIVASYVTHDSVALYLLTYENGTWEVCTRGASDGEAVGNEDVKWCATEFEARSVFERLVIEDVTDYWQKKGGM